MPAAARRCARRADGVAAQDPAPEAEVAALNQASAVRRQLTSRIARWRLLTRWLDIPDLRKLEVYRAHGGYEAVRKALTEHEPEQLIKRSRPRTLRGRGGAAFPTGMKWSFMPKQPKKPVYLCCNADESEPGTFENRYHRKRPARHHRRHLIILPRDQCHLAYIYIRGEFSRAEARLRGRARGAARPASSARTSSAPASIWRSGTHRGAGAYICGEETGLLESLEGKRGYPRNRPPFPAIQGPFGCPDRREQRRDPGNVPHIITARRRLVSAASGRRRARARNCSASRATSIRPGVYELPMGFPLQDLIYEHRRRHPRRPQLKAVIPGGSSLPVFTAEERST